MNIYFMLGEASTTRISQKRKPKEMPEHKKVAHDGGEVAGIARNELEKRTGERVSTRNNYLSHHKKPKKLAE